MFGEFRVLLIASSVLAGLSYLTNVFLANEMGPDIFGKYSYALVLGATMAQFISFGTTETGVRIQGKFGMEAMDWVLSVRIINFALVSLGVLVALLYEFDPLLIFGIISALNALSYSTHYEVQRINIRYAKVYLIERMMITILIWMGILFLDSNYLIFVFSVLFLVQTGALIFQIFDNRQFGLNFKPLLLYGVYKEGFFILIFSLSKFAYAGGTKIIIFQQLGSEKLGVFSTAWQFVPLSTIFFAQATKAWRLSITQSVDSRDLDGFTKHISHLLLAAFGSTGLVCVAFAAFGDELINLLFSDEYTSAADLMPYIGIYLLVVALDSVAILVAIALSSAKTAGLCYAIFGIGTASLSLYFSASQSLETLMIVVIMGHFLAASSLTFLSLRKLKVVFG